MGRNLVSIRVQTGKVGSHYPISYRDTYAGARCPVCGTCRYDIFIGRDLHETSLSEKRFTCKGCGIVFGPTGEDVFVFVEMDRG